MEDKKSLNARCKEGWNRHKKKVLIAGGVVIGLAGGYYLVHHRDDLYKQVSRLFEKQKLQEAVAEVSEKVPDTEIESAINGREIREVKVPPHVMNLPKGKRASEAAKAFAKECKFELGEGQTARHGYTRAMVA